MKDVYMALIVAVTAMVLLFKFLNLESVTVSLFRRRPPRAPSDEIRSSLPIQQEEPI